MIKKTAFLLLAAVCAAPGFARAEAHPGAKAAKAAEGINVKISYKMKLDGQESSGSFVTQSGTQTNNVLKEEAPCEADASTGKKAHNGRGAIVNALPILTAGGKASVELQAEMTEPLDAGGKAGQVKTFQYQGTFSAELGRTIVLVDAPDRHFELEIEELPAK